VLFRLRYRSVFILDDLAVAPTDETRNAFDAAFSGVREQEWDRWADKVSQKPDISILVSPQFSKSYHYLEKKELRFRTPNSLIASTNCICMTWRVATKQKLVGEVYGYY
jgi:hypothetical protein